MSASLGCASVNGSYLYPQEITTRKTSPLKVLNPANQPYWNKLPHSFNCIFILGKAKLKQTSSQLWSAFW